MEDGSSLDCLEAKTFTESHGNDDSLIEDCVDSADHDRAKQKSLFCQNFLVYLKENCTGSNVRPVPVILGDGQLLDLYQLFSLVKEKGGYDVVSRKGLWRSVIVELGLDLHVLASVKLIYYKYLRDFEGWLSKTKRTTINQKSDGSLLGTKNLNNKCEGVQHVGGDDEKIGNGVKGDLPASYVDVSGEEFDSHKRKRESISGMVNSTRQIAKHPIDLVAQNVEPNNGSSSQKVKMHPGKSKLTKKKKSEPSGGDYPVKHVPIGPRFQAEVPQWTDEVYVSDPKWLGTQVWSVKDDSEPSTETDLVVGGRRGKCSCDIQGSVDCVRFLIDENRRKLKLELGSAFYDWGFDKMGEEVSHQWTADEENKFKDAMRLSIPSENNSFWNNPSEYFLKKTRKDMVSYYFNVYVIQLRSYQNRVTPETVDSDDDKVEFGSFGDGFERSSIKHPPMEFKECSENRQCLDYELTKQNDKPF